MMSAQDKNPDRRLFIYGRNPVLEALKSGQKLAGVHIYGGISRDDKELLKKLCSERCIELKEISKEEMSRLAKTEKHQGVVAVIESYDALTLAEAVEYIEAAEKPRLVVILDSVNDPHNLGAVLRTMAAAKGTLLMMNQSNSAPISETVIKVSSGGIFYVPVCSTNLAQAMERLKKIGFWVYGFEADSTKEYWKTDFTGDVALVFGSEGEGLRELTRKNCDELLKIPLSGRISSLNLSVSAALGIFETVRQRKMQK